MLIHLNDVRQALEKEALVPCFQPIIELRTGRLAGFEVLARWEHPDYGLILPENFISLAEQNGFIGLLTRQILTKAFLAANLLPKPLFLAVNISPIQLHHLSLPQQIRNLAEEHLFPLKQLMVEITESALVNNLERARKIAVEIKEMGCQLALDDFGTGYSSLHHLRALPFEKLKVDRSFVQSMTRERESRKIVAAVVGLAYSLDMVTVAEGVETEEQAAMLLGLGCELGQGWLFGCALAAEYLPAMIAAPPRMPCTSLTAHRCSIALSSRDVLPAQRLAQLQAIYEGTPVGLCFLDKNLRYVSVNQRLANMNGPPVEAHVGRPVCEVIPAVFPLLEPYLHRALRGEVISKVEFPRPAQTGQSVLVSYQPVLDEAEEVIGISVTAVDVAEL